VTIFLGYYKEDLESVITRFSECSDPELFAKFLLEFSNRMKHASAVASRWQIQAIRSGGGTSLPLGRGGGILMGGIGGGRDESSIIDLVDFLQNNLACVNIVYGVRLDKYNRSRMSETRIGTTQTRAGVGDKMSLLTGPIFG